MLVQREPQIVEDEKNVAMIKGSTANEAVMKVIRDLHRLKKTHSILMTKKNDFRPFEDATGLEFVVGKSDCGLFAFGSHSKKRPTNLVLGRTFDGHILDMFEFGVENVKLLQDFKNAKISLAPKPLLTFAGEAFESDPDFIRMKNFFIDFFSGPKTDGMRLAGVENVISFTVIDGRIYFKHYRIILMKSGTTTPRVELEEVGPRFELVVRRKQLASEDLFRRSLKQPYQLKPKKTKNISISELGTTFGRVHVGTQDFKKLTSKQVRGGKKRSASRKRAAAAGAAVAPGPDMAAVEQLERMNPTKKARIG